MLKQIQRYLPIRLVILLCKTRPFSSRHASITFSCSQAISLFACCKSYKGEGLLTCFTCSVPNKTQQAANCLSTRAYALNLCTCCSAVVVLASNPSCSVMVRETSFDPNTRYCLMTTGNRPLSIPTIQPPSIHSPNRSWLANL